MLSLISGFRNIRVSLITGGMIVISAYILLYDMLFDHITFRPMVATLLALSKWVPLVLIISISFVVGSLYTTLLEGLVDDCHRKYIHLDVELIPSKTKRIIMRALLPYSFAAKRRLISETKSFFKDNFDVTEGDFEICERRFIDMVLTEVLWMEGKLSGTAMEQPYDRIRSDGEVRVAGGLLMPLVATALSYALYANFYIMIAALFLGIVLAIPMVNYGLYYFKKANSFLAHHIADGKVLSPAMESLKREADRRRILLIPAVTPPITIVNN